MYCHASGSTGVIDSRLPRASMLHFGQRLVLAQFGQRRPAGFFDETEIDMQPARIVAAWLFRRSICSCGRTAWRRDRRLADFGDADDARLLAAGVIEERLVAGFHLVAHEIARLVIAHAGPRRGFVAGEIVDAVGVGFGFHQPVAHVGCPEMLHIKKCGCAALSLQCH